MKRLVLSLLLIAAALPAFAAQPQLIRSTPADGETNIPLDIQVIRFYFDQNMKMNQWTFWMSDKGTFPPMAGPNDAPWRDPRTCEFSVGMLEPNTTYAIQLNSKLRQGFRSAEQNEPLPVTVVVFRTGTGRSAEKPASPPEPAGPRPPADPESEVLQKFSSDLLKAWQAKDVDTIAAKATNKTMRKLFSIKGTDSTDPVWAAMFAGDVWESVKTWDGGNPEIDRVSDTEARAVFNERPDGKKALLVLVQEDGDWRFQKIEIGETPVEKGMDAGTAEGSGPESPSRVAEAVLKAYRQKDCDAIAQYATAFNKKLLKSVAEKGQAHPRYNSIFGGHRMAAVNDWDGRIRGERIDSKTEARVTISDPDAEGNIIQVALVREDGRWCFEDLAFDEVVTRSPEQPLQVEPGEAGAAGGFDWEGDWLYEDPTVKVAVRFSNGNRYSRTTTTQQGIETASGSYATANGILELREDGGDVVRFPYRVQDSNTFEVQDAGEWIPIRRQ